MNPVLDIGLLHFLVVSFLLAGAGVATLLTKRNAIGILIGVELILNAAAINFVAFNHYSWPLAPVTDTMHAVNPGMPLRGYQVGSVLEPNAEGVLTPVAGSSHLAYSLNSAIDGQMFSIFIIVLAAAEAAIALAIFLNFYNNFSSIDVDKAHELKG